jgi:hypothetical protein
MAVGLGPRLGHGGVGDARRTGGLGAHRVSWTGVGRRGLRGLGCRWDTDGGRAASARIAALAFSAAM